MGYYLWSGMSAGAAYIRGNVLDSHLGVGVKKIDYLTDNDIDFLILEIENFIKTFINVDIDSTYNEHLKNFADKFYKDSDNILKDFCKIIPITTNEMRSNE
jgi:glutamate synthase domain-containing protein 3